jgi:Ca2+-binding EF-hand superfamily protein
MSVLCHRFVYIFSFIFLCDAVRAVCCWHKKYHITALLHSYHSFDQMNKFTKSISKKASKLQNQAKTCANSFTKSEQFKTKLREVFDDADVNKNGIIDHTEAYGLVLKLYLVVAQNTGVVTTNIPSQKQVKKMIKESEGADSPHDGSIDFDEFEAMAIILCSDIAVQISTQQFVKLVLSPCIAVWAVSILVWFLTTELYKGHTPVAQHFTWVPGFVLNETFAVTIFTVLLNMHLLPKLLKLMFRAKKEILSDNDDDSKKMLINFVINCEVDD